MRRTLVHVAALGVALAITTSGLAGCADLRDQVNGASVEPDNDTVGVAPVLEEVEWSVTDGLLSVIVRNTNPDTLRSARVSLTAYSAKHAALASVSGDSMITESACCTVVDLAPDAEYGLYFALGADVGARVADIDLGFSDISFGEPEAASRPQIGATAQRTVLNRSRTTVAATLTNGSSPVSLALVQAVLRGQSGRLIAVVTGRWTCLRANETRPINVELFQPVPAGTVVDTITARPLTGPNTPSCQQRDQRPPTA